MNKKHFGVAFGLFGFAALGASFPYYYVKNHQTKNRNLLQQQDPLSGSQVIRGAYLNTGSKDAGPDPNWDWETRSYKGKYKFTEETLKESQAKQNKNE
mmetsp:Transcript_17505/g.21558  ORF Transcript_17505/g.21558 Transcript_17505/m.21558 type:complete len:98 (+) Transcript_17505:133-426(+)